MSAPVPAHYGIYRNPTHRQRRHTILTGKARDTMRRDVLYMLRPLNVFQPLRQCRANAIDIIFENVLIFLRYRDKTGIVSYDPADR